MNEITVVELKSMMDTKADFQLIDIREEYEYDIADIGGEKMLMGDIISNVEKISKDKKVIIYCRSGNRSAAVISVLETQFNFKNLYNLKGGIVAYANEIDTSLTKY